MPWGRVSFSKSHKSALWASGGKLALMVSFPWIVMEPRFQPCTVVSFGLFTAQLHLLQAVNILPLSPIPCDSIFPCVAQPPPSQIWIYQHCFFLNHNRSLFLVNLIFPKFKHSSRAVHCTNMSDPVIQEGLQPETVFMEPSLFFHISLEWFQKPSQHQFLKLLTCILLT